MTVSLPSINLFFNLTRDIIFVIFYAGTINSNYTGSRWRKYLALFLLILLNVSMLVSDHYFYEILFDSFPARWGHAIIAFFRNVVYFFSYFLYVWIGKGATAFMSLYAAVRISVICLSCHNIFLTPLMKPILDVTVVWVSNLFLNQLLCNIILNIVSMFLYFLAYKFIPLNGINTVGAARFLLAFCLFLISLYFNSTIKAIEFIGDEYERQLSEYVIIVQFLLLICIAYFEHYQDAIQARHRIELENQAVYSLLSKIEEQEENDLYVRRMRHDLRNHLIALRYVVANGEDKKAIEYLDSMLDEAVSFESRIKTGNLIMDGILTQKIGTAHKSHVAISVSADFSPLEYIEKTDLCIIWGNLLDNALEACEKVTDVPRFINIRGRRIGETVVYRIENSFHDNLEFSGGIPITTKSEKHLHGIGLKSVLRTLEKYGGTITFLKKENIFSVVCTFPHTADFPP